MTPSPHHGDTGITGVVTCRLTSGEISSSSQPYLPHKQREVRRDD